MHSTGSMQLVVVPWCCRVKQQQIMILWWIVVTVVFVSVNNIWETLYNVQESVPKFLLRNTNTNTNTNATLIIKRNDHNGPWRDHGDDDDDDDDDGGVVLLYPQNPQRFTNILFQCLEEPKCHFLYHHVPKTAGSFIASSLFPIFEHGERYRSREWCCFEIVMGKFFNNTEDYCVRRKMGVYEVRGDEYAQVLETCEEKYSDAGHTYVGLVTTREPIQRTLSLIHQQCNSGYDKKNPRYQAFCRNCTYDSNSEEFWQRFIDDTNNAYVTMDEYLNDRKAAAAAAAVALLVVAGGDDDFVSPSSSTIRERRSSGGGTTSSSSSSSASTKNKSPVLVIDNSMVNDFFQRLDAGLEERNRATIQRGETNPEDLSVCNFGMTSRMFKLLRPANSVFLDLWSGYYHRYDEEVGSRSKDAKI
jgi:hypothetical protein